MSQMKRVCSACNGQGHAIGYTFWGWLRFWFYYLTRQETPGPVRIECKKCASSGSFIGDVICVDGVTVFPYGKSQEKVVFEYHSGMHILLDPSEESVVALSSGYKPLAEFKKRNNLRGYVMSQISCLNARYV